MKSTSVLLFLGLVGLGSVAQAQMPAQKIGVFDAARLSSESALGKTVTARLNALQEQRKTELQAKAKAVQDLQAQLDAQALSLSPERRAAIEKDIQRKSLELNQAQEAARSEIQIEYGEEQEKFQQKMLVVVEQFSQDQGFSMILEKSSTAYSDPAIDVTTALVDQFNRIFPPAPAEPAKPESKK